jgi:hypothetical protein
MIVADGFVGFTKLFKYLGSSVSSSLNDDGEVDLRIKAAGGPIREMAKGRVPTPKYSVLLQEAGLRGHHLSDAFVWLRGLGNHSQVVGQTSKMPPQVHTANVQTNHRTYVEASDLH